MYYDMTNILKVNIYNIMTTRITNHSFESTYQNKHIVKAHNFTQVRGEKAHKVLCPQFFCHK